MSVSIQQHQMKKATKMVIREHFKQQLELIQHRAKCLYYDIDSKHNLSKNRAKMIMEAADDLKRNIKKL